VLHHAGKSGDQLGTAAKKFVLHTVIQLKHPSDYTSNEGLRCEVTFQKVRKFKAKNSMAFVPFELKMEEDPRGALFWMRRPLQDILEAQTIECLRSGMTPTEIEKELGINRRKIYRIGHESGLMKPKQ
jgi:putative DNA primase/helicase